MQSSLSSAALQSPIEYQRRESSTNSLGRSMKSAGVQPNDSSSPMDRRHQPCLLFYNNSLPSLHSPRLSSMSQVIHSHSLVCAQACIAVLSIFFILTKCLFRFKVPNASAVSLRATHPPFSSHQRLSLSTEVKHDCSTFSTLSPCSHHCCKVGQARFVMHSSLNSYHFFKVLWP